jgi:DNA excision repair protein ERCC-3
MTYNPQNPLIVQSDRSILVEVDNALYEQARDALAPFAELEKSPEHIHTYRLTDISLWNAAAAGMTAREMMDVLVRFSKFPVPGNLEADITERVGRYGRLQLIRKDGELRLVCGDLPLLRELARQKELQKYLSDPIDTSTYRIADGDRGVLKQALIRVGYPAEDLAGYVAGADLPMALRELARTGVPFTVRDYQKLAADAFHAGGDVRGGSGVIVLPCGAGKTIVGIAVMGKLQKSTLILTTGVTAVKQWHRELLDKTDLDDSAIGEYTGEQKQIAPVTLATYQIVTYRPDKAEKFPHFEIFNRRDWGLIIYDEVHLLPAPVFRVTAEIQARRRLGLTATLVREDGREGDVFTLIGPKKYDVPWRVLEQKGWIAEANCTEIRCAFTPEQRMEYALAPWRQQFRLASENPVKEDVCAAVFARHANSRVLIIGQYLHQLRLLAKRFRIPLITGQTSQPEREDLYHRFRIGKLPRLILSKVGNFALDLPDANVLIQVSGTFGSRQEEAQRLGRILRPKEDGKGAHFYTIVTRDTKELDFSHHRQLFLTEQGYSYEILDAGELLASDQTDHAATASDALPQTIPAPSAPTAAPSAPTGRRRA